MFKIPEKYFSWRVIAIAAMLYTLFLTGVGLGGGYAAAAQSPALLTAEDVSPQEESLLIITADSSDNNDDGTATDVNAASVETQTPQAVVYCTHASEEYYGQVRTSGVAGGVMEAARTLAATLEERGIKTILLEDVFDSPDWNNAYGNSLAALEKVKAQYPDIQLFVDVHRDSDIPGLDTHYSDSSGVYAKMLLIVGSNVNLPHPNWEQNKAFAEQLYNKLESAKPGLMRDTKIYNGRYNQHMGTKAILVEMGSTNNTVEEAKNSAKLLGNSIADIF